MSREYDELTAINKSEFSNGHCLVIGELRLRLGESEVEIMNEIAKINLTYNLDLMLEQDKLTLNDALIATLKFTGDSILRKVTVWYENCNVEYLNNNVIKTGAANKGYMINAVKFNSKFWGACYNPKNKEITYRVFSGKFDVGNIENVEIQSTGHRLTKEMVQSLAEELKKAYTQMSASRFSVRNAVKEERRARYIDGKQKEKEASALRKQGNTKLGEVIEAHSENGKDLESLPLNECDGCGGETSEYYWWVVGECFFMKRKREVTNLTTIEESIKNKMKLHEFLCRMCKGKGREEFKKVGNTQLANFLNSKMRGDCATYLKLLDIYSTMSSIHGKVDSYEYKDGIWGIIRGRGENARVTPLFWVYREYKSLGSPKPNKEIWMWKIEGDSEFKQLNYDWESCNRVPGARLADLINKKGFIKNNILNEYKLNEGFIGYAKKNIFNTDKKKMVIPQWKLEEMFNMPERQEITSIVTSTRGSFDGVTLEFYPPKHVTAENLYKWFEENGETACNMFRGHCRKVGKTYDVSNSYIRVMGIKECSQGPAVLVFVGGK